MADEPRRLMDDVHAPAAARDDLRRVARLGAAPLDVDLGLERLQSGLEHARGAATGASQTLWWTGGALLVAVSALVLWSAQPRLPSAAPRVPPRAPAATSPTREPPVETVQSPALEHDGGSAAQPPRRARPVDPDARLRRELAHLAKLRSIAAQDPRQALRLADEGQRAFQGGMFTEEREAIAVLALHALGRSAAARSRARAFLARYSEGPFADRLRAIADHHEGAASSGTSPHGGSR